MAKNAHFPQFLRIGTDLWCVFPIVSTLWHMHTKYCTYSAGFFLSFRFRISRHAQFGWAGMQGCHNSCGSLKRFSFREYLLADRPMLFFPTHIWVSESFFAALADTTRKTLFACLRQKGQALGAAFQVANHPSEGLTVASCPLTTADAVSVKATLRQSRLSPLNPSNSRCWSLDMPSPASLDDTKQLRSA